MSRPYSSTDFAPAPTNSQRLTPRGEATVRELIEQDETRLSGMRSAREELLGEVDSITTVIEDLAQTIDRRRSLLVGDIISLLPVDQPAGSLFTPQGDPLAHSAQWGEQDPSPTGVHPTPTRCGACQERVTTTERGWVHVGRELMDDGNLCNPNRPHDSPSAKPAAPGEMSADPETLIANFEAAHQEHDATKGGRR